RHGQVLAHEPGDPLDGRAQPETCRDVLADTRCCGRGEGADGGGSACCDGVAESPVVGPEVVPPARDAVRLVDDETIDGEPAEVVEEARRAEAFRGKVEEPK